MYWHWISNYPINWFNPTTFLCLFEAGTLISNVMSWLLIFHELSDDCSFCWYWYNCWLSSLFELSFPNYINSKLLSSLGICVTNDHGYVPFVVITIWPFPHSRFITRFVKRLTWQAPYGAGAAYPSGAPEFTPGFLHALVGCMLFALSNYMSSRFWFHVVMYATIST